MLARNIQTTGKSVSEFLAELQTQIQEHHDFADEHAAVEQQRYTDTRRWSNSDERRKLNSDQNRKVSWRHSLA